MYTEVETPHRSRKDRRKWCRGKPGVEHAPAVRLSGLARYWLTKDPERAVCRWRHGYKFGGFPGSGYVPDLESWTYECHHEEGCSACGKVLDSRLVERCPDYHKRGSN